MDGSVYTTALQAIHASLHSATPKLQRDAANEYLESLQTQQQCMQILLHILTTAAPAGALEHTESVQQLSLSLMAEFLKSWWDRLGSSDRLHIRHSLFVLLHCLPPTSSGGMRNKVASIIADIAERSYPQHWPTFLEELVNVWTGKAPPPPGHSTGTGSGGEAQQEVCVLTLRYLIEDCIDGDFSSQLPAARRQDILKGLQVGLRPLLTVTHAFLLQCAHTVASSGTSGGAGASASAGATRLLVAALSLVGALASFAKPADLCPTSSGSGSGDNLPPVGSAAASAGDFALVVVQLLSVPSPSSVVQIEAASVLLIITGQKLQLASQAWHLMKIVADTPVTCLPDGGGASGDSLYFQRLYSTSVFQLLSANATLLLTPLTVTTAIANSTRGEEMQLLQRYMQLSCSLMLQPSRRLAADAITSWVRLLKEPSIAKAPLQWVQEIVPFLLSTYISRCMRSCWDQDADCPGPDTSALPAENAAESEMGIVQEVDVEEFEDGLVRPSVHMDV